MFHQNPIKELAENVVNTRFEERVSPLTPLPVASIGSKISKTLFFHSNSSIC